MRRSASYPCAKTVRKGRLSAGAQHLLLLCLVQFRIPFWDMNAREIHAEEQPMWISNRIQSISAALQMNARPSFQQLRP
eukprot:7303567-Pyramimonas_sp.AAC.1